MDHQRIQIQIIIALAGLTVMFTGLFNHHIWTPDEPRVAAISLEMSKTGDMVIPRLGGKPFVEKPPLYFATGAVFIKFLGEKIGSTNTLRVVSALFGLGTVVMTFLLTRRLYGKPSAVLAAALLSTMSGFVINFHWIRVDAALCFFVIAAVWSFSEVYFAQKSWFCLGAGLFLAGSFLIKGLIGPILISIPWFGMFLLWIVDLKKTGMTYKALHIIEHLSGLAAFISLPVIWMILFKEKGGPDLWHEWFWVNHIGRFTGKAAVLGHIHRGEPLYYIKQLAIDSMPWFPLILMWLWGFSKQIYKKVRPSNSDNFIFIWGACSILLLSISITKRDIYLAPVYPAFAIAGSRMLAKEIDNKFLKGFYFFWALTGLIILAAIAGASVLTPFLKDKLAAATIGYMKTFGFGNFLAVLGFAGCLYISAAWIKGRMEAGRIILLTCIIYTCLLITPIKIIDMEKNFQPGITAFANRIPNDQHQSIAAYRLSETATACFYYYSDWSLNHTNVEEQVKKIVAGKDAEFKSVILPSKLSLPRAIDYFDKLFEGIPYRIKNKQYVGAVGRQRGFFWIEGDCAK